MDMIGRNVMLIISGSWKVNRKHLTYMYIDEETTEEWFYVLHVVCMCLKVHTHVHILFKC